MPDTALDPLASIPQEDWADLARFREANARLAPPRPNEERVVFYGASMVEQWAPYFDRDFPGKPYINRGIGGQTSPQLLVRFRPDVIALRPRLALILVGTNDVAGNTGPMTLEDSAANIASMTELALANGIRVVLASITPSTDIPWRPGLQPADKIRARNAWTRAFAESRGIVYADFHSALANAEGGMRAEWTTDGVHANADGYAVMAPIARQAIADALARS